MKLRLIIILLCFIQPVFAQKTIRVGSKHFNEGYILSEMLSLLLEDRGFVVERKFSLGGTSVCFEALRNGAIDVYPEYTGTISSEILKENSSLKTLEIKQLLDNKYKLAMSETFGFNNTYALLIKPEIAQKYQLKNISDLRKVPNLKGGLSYEFLKRKDGWAKLSAFYGLKQNPVGLEHGLAYKAILNNEIDFTDAYSTDGEIKKHKLILLNDDLKFFPAYQAVALYSPEIPDDAKKAINKLQGLITETEMQGLNAMALFEKKNFKEIAQSFLVEKRLIKKQKTETNNTYEEIFVQSLVHLKLTFLSLFLAICFAIPLGIFLYRFQALLKPVLYVTSILQTVPSIALLALMIPWLGIGVIPAVVALFIYAILPILRNTIIGLYSVDPQLKKVATAIGLTKSKRLFLIELPLAAPMIITGIRTAAVINVGTATLAAFIGAGGLGEFIVTGLALNNTQLILQGAIPSAILAILMELGFEAFERLIVSKHLRQKILN
jgi:osmoprotectant transport system permease protein